MKEQFSQDFKNFLPDWTPSKKIHFAALGLILFLSLGLRLYGITWGLPDETHIFSYHVDERNVYYAISNINPRNLDFNPNYFIYPTFHIYLIFSILLASGAGLLPTAVSILTGRYVTVFFGVLTTYIVYLLGREIHSEEMGLFTASFLAITPLHVVHSHFFTNDVPVTFWILTSLFFSFKILNSSHKKWYVLAGITGGLALSTKYNAGFVIFPILTAHIMGRSNLTGAQQIFLEKKILLTVFLFLLTFLSTSPYSLLAFTEFKRDTVLINLYLNTINPEWFGTGSGWIYHIGNSLYYGMGPPLLAFAFFGAGFLLWKKKPQSILLFSFIIPYYLLVGHWQVRFARFILPIVPFLVLFAAFGLSHIWSRAKKAGVLIFLALFIYISILTVSYDQIMASSDPRDQAHNWINHNIQPSSTIGLPSTFQYFTPPLDTKKYNLIFTWNITELKEKNVDYYIISDLDYRGYLKSKRTIERYHSESTFFDYLFNGTDYRIVKTFQNSQRFLFIDLSEEYLPQDMKYANPKIVIFERSNPSRIK
jgi:uncharacterized membrane protein